MMPPMGPPPPMMPPGAAAGMPQPDADGAKLPHAAVHYGLAKPNGDKCATCTHFHGKDDCDLVVAPIYPGGWCEKFAPKDVDAGMSDPAAMGGMGAAPVIAPAPVASVAPQVAMVHGRAIAGAKALHSVGHISAKERDKHIQASQAALAKPRKPFGSWSQ